MMRLDPERQRGISASSDTIKPRADILSRSGRSVGPLVRGLEGAPAPMDPLGSAPPIRCARVRHQQKKKGAEVSPPPPPTPNQSANQPISQPPVMCCVCAGPRSCATSATRKPQAAKRGSTPQEAQ
jgi:hypothetical protein